MFTCTSVTIDYLIELFSLHIYKAHTQYIHQRMHHKKFNKIICIRILLNYGKMCIRLNQFLTHPMFVSIIFNTEGLIWTLADKFFLMPFI